MTNPSSNESSNDSRTATIVRTEGDLEIVVERTFTAPKALVFRAYTDPQWMSQWWAPEGFTMEIKQMDVRPGGVWHYCMRSKEWGDAWGKGTYTEVTPSDRIGWIDAFSDEAGASIPPESSMVASFTEIAPANQGEVESTLLTMRNTYATAEDRQKVLEMGMVEGITSGSEKLVTLITSENAKRGYEIKRTLNAPRELVWDCYTIPEHFAAWFGSEGYPLVDVKMDVRQGGTWTGTMLTPEGGKIPWSGFYTEVEKPHRLVIGITDEPNPEPGRYDYLTITLEERAGKTEMTLTQTGGHLSDDGYEMARQGTSSFIDAMEALLARLQA